VLVWLIASHLYDRRTAMAAAVLYCANPLVLISAVRVDQEAIITFLIVAGLAFLIARQSHKAALLAGACLGIAFWVKYPAALFLPVFLLAAPRRALACVGGFLASVLVLFAPYVDQLNRLYQDSVVWQLFHRNHSSPIVRFRAIGTYWLGVNPFAVVGAFIIRKPVWLWLGFLSGGVYLFSSTTYPHYFVPLAPFAALLGAPIAARYVRVPRAAVIAAALAAALLTAITLRPLATVDGFVHAPLVSATDPVADAITHYVPSGTSVIANRLEFAYLAPRPLVPYFWNDHQFVSARSLEKRLPDGGAVIMYPFSEGASYPAGFTAYLNRHFRRLTINRSYVWLLSHERNAAG
jgi:Dolichyl-phosphate-mannose-protein mannosyltransferase